MIEGKKVLAIIPARGGSKGIPNKNIIDLGGKPLIAHSIEVAKQSNYIDDIVVSTDSKPISDIAKKWGADVPFYRPSKLASDTSKTIETVIYTIDELKKRRRLYDILVLLQPTQPFRKVSDIDAAIKLHIKTNEDIVSVSSVKDNPILIRSLDDKGHLKNLLPCSSTVRRQEMPIYVRVDGSIYINKISTLTETTSFNDNPMGYLITNSYMVDIDTNRDLEWARYLYAHKMDIDKV
ncbi:cytidylyltransferase domain-containing protein [Veillonella montpellierensis]|uniref:acylneuraminate cytidylyltransferase family protein n=1 Tax=Veillonella montpellierensis TaxID=187328 RepID=UPI000424AFE0|nr:acylneuraminate cytidylyltransferase family protein [Veillonella montpellierensis]